MKSRLCKALFNLREAASIQNKDPSLSEEVIRCIIRIENILDEYFNGARPCGVCGEPGTVVNINYTDGEIYLCDICHEDALNAKEDTIWKRIENGEP